MSKRDGDCWDCRHPWSRHGVHGGCEGVDKPCACSKWRAPRDNYMIHCSHDGCAATIMSAHQLTSPVYCGEHAPAPQAEGEAWHEHSVAALVNEMLDADMALYERILETPRFARAFNDLCKLPPAARAEGYAQAEWDTRAACVAELRAAAVIHQENSAKVEGLERIGHAFAAGGYGAAAGLLEANVRSDRKETP